MWCIVQNHWEERSRPMRGTENNCRVVVPLVTDEAAAIRWCEEKNKGVHPEEFRYEVKPIRPLFTFEEIQAWWGSDEANAVLHGPKHP